MRWLIVLLLAGCAVSSSPSSAPAASPTATSTATAATPTPSPCSPSDQDQYVYHPARLVVLAVCIRVTGSVAAIRKEADGDRHLLLALDPQFAYLLTPANNGVELGDLVVEPVCIGNVTQADAIAICAADLDPLKVLPFVGQHVWMEGRYVTDSDHGGWAELHPLYAWGSW
jgi:hypothetical protein